VGLDEDRPEPVADGRSASEPCRFPWLGRAPETTARARAVEGCGPPRPSGGDREQTDTADRAASFAVHPIGPAHAGSLHGAALPDADLRTARVKRLRFHLFTVTGRIVRDRRKIRLRLAASREWIARLLALFE